MKVHRLKSLTALDVASVIQIMDSQTVWFTTVHQGSIQTSGQFLNDVQGSFIVKNLGQSCGGLFTNNGMVSGHGRLKHQLQNNGVVAVNAGAT